MNILIVDDEKIFIDTMELILLSNDYFSSAATSGEEALKFMENNPVDLVITDYKMKGINGIELLQMVKERYPKTEVIIVTGYGDVKHAVQAMKLGAFAYFVKSHDPEELILEVKKIEKMINFQKKIDSLSVENVFLESDNAAFKKALSLATRAANSNTNILLLGESGSGKEVFANYIHNLSGRRENPFIAVNCHAFSETLLHSELYGHEKGSFTGATNLRIGKIEAANTGTLFLDEVGDTSLDVQVNLLRAIDTKSIERVGSNKLIPVDFRLICATNRNMKEIIETGEFREDFYYRISTIVITIPPLRERREDLEKLINYFISIFGIEMKKNITGVEPEALNVLMNYDYPGNIRELKNIIERMVVLSIDGVISVDDIPEEIKGTSTYKMTLKDIRNLAEKKHIQKKLMINNFNMTKTAEELDISRRQLFNKINELGIKKP